MDLVKAAAKNTRDRPNDKIVKEQAQKLLNFLELQNRRREEANDDPERREYCKILI